MNCRERFLAAVKHQIPDRIPTCMINAEEPGYYASMLGFEDSFKMGECFGFGTMRGVIPVYKGLNLGSYTNKSDPLYAPLAEATTVREIENFPWPGVDENDYQTLTHINNYDGYDENVSTIWGPCTYFNQILDLFGLENAMINMCLNPGLVEAALAHIEYYHYESIKKTLELSICKPDFYFHWDDFATQRGMMISPELWRKFFKPAYKKIFELTKSHGLYVWLHSCGAIREVLPDLIDIGLDMWETVQPNLPGNEPEGLKKDFGKHITFYGAVSAQTTLTFGTPEQVRAEVRERIRVLGKGGGYICGPDHEIKSNVPVENVFALYEEALKFKEEGYTLI